MTRTVIKSQPPALAIEANRVHKLCQDAQRAAAEYARECGELLLKAKSEVRHGDWESWINTHCVFSIRTARRYMAIASNWEKIQQRAGAKGTRASVLTIRAALRMLTTDRRVNESDECVRYCPSCGGEMATTSREFVTCVECWNCRLYPRAPGDRIWTPGSSAFLGEAWQATDSRERKQFLDRSAAEMGCKIVDGPTVPHSSSREK